MSECNIKFDIKEYLQSMEKRLRGDIQNVKQENNTRLAEHEKSTKTLVNGIEAEVRQVLEYQTKQCGEIKRTTNVKCELCNAVFQAEYDYDNICQKCWENHRIETVDERDLYINDSA